MPLSAYNASSLALGYDVVQVAYEISSRVINDVDRSGSEILMPEGAALLNRVWYASRACFDASVVLIAKCGAGYVPKL